MQLSSILHLTCIDDVVIKDKTPKAKMLGNFPQGTKHNTTSLRTTNHEFHKPIHCGYILYSLLNLNTIDTKYINNIYIILNFH